MPENLEKFALVALKIVISLLLSITTYKLIEKPGRDFLKKAF
jgi:peptidoglycan/LPS O-acetylase OafA/YrhL